MLFFESGELHNLLPEGLTLWNAVVFWLGVFGLFVPFLGPFETPETSPCAVTIVWYVECASLIVGGIAGLALIVIVAIIALLHFMRKAK